MPAPTPYNTPSNTRSSTPINPQRPQGWNSEMTRFVRDALLNGEDSTSIVILIETEFPQMRSKVTKVWVEEVGRSPPWGLEEV